MAEPRGIHRRLFIELTGDVLNRFNAKVDRSAGPDACWPWTGADRGNGYGAIKVAGKVVSSHVMAWVVVNGEIPDGHILRHTCDNRPYCNPAHLLCGTPKENVADMDDRGRRKNARGEGAASSKLTRKAVIEAKRRKADGESGRDLAKHFGVCPSTMNSALRGETWAHIDGPAVQS